VDTGQTDVYAYVCTVYELVIRQTDNESLHKTNQMQLDVL